MHYCDQNDHKYIDCLYETCSLRVTETKMLACSEKVHIRVKYNLLITKVFDLH